MSDSNSLLWKHRRTRILRILSNKRLRLRLGLPFGGVLRLKMPRLQTKVEKMLSKKLFLGNQSAPLQGNSAWMNRRLNRFIISLFALARSTTRKFWMTNLKQTLHHLRIRGITKVPSKLQFLPVRNKAGLRNIRNIKIQPQKNTIGRVAHLARHKRIQPRLTLINSVNDRIIDSRLLLPKPTRRQIQLGPTEMSLKPIRRLLRPSNHSKESQALSVWLLLKATTARAIHCHHI